MIAKKKMSVRFLSLLFLSLFTFSVYAQEGADDWRDKVSDKDKNKRSKSRSRGEDINPKSIPAFNAKGDKTARGFEKEADKRYVAQDFEKAMSIYENATKNATSTEYIATLNLKVARLYLNLLNYTASVPHFDIAMDNDPSLFNTIDVCNYLDALRHSGQKMKAIKVGRNYAFLDDYKKDHRYQNILHGLNYDKGFMPIGAPSFIVTRLNDINTNNSEFWVGRMKDEFFYATSGSNFHDPSKKFYFRTKYYSLDEESEFSAKKQAAFESTSREPKGILKNIPADLQNGPVSYSDDIKLMVTTSLTKGKKDEIKMSSKGIALFNTNLFLSRKDDKRGGWTSFKIAFEQQKDASYAHPFIIGNGQSILFSSDMDGGFGGYDIYIAHWDEKLKTWGSPINLGAQVNTEGDEISPSIDGDNLIFASNGHIGFGGYDLYSILYENGKLIKGSLYHFDYPINSEFNDFCMLKFDDESGYFISDRRRATKDDIYYYERNKEEGKSSTFFGMSESEAVSNGTIGLLSDEGTSNEPRNEKLPRRSEGNVSNSLPSLTSPDGTTVTTEATPGEVLLTVYFDFDKHTLTPVAVKELQNFVKNKELGNVTTMTIEGYADEMGKEDYNIKLSQRRAEIVSGWLSKQGIHIKTNVVARGSISLSPEEKKKSDTTPTPEFHYGESRPKIIYSVWDQRNWMNRKARRVEIKAVMK